MTDGKQQSKKAGRPPKTPEEGKRTTRTFRCRPDLDSKLQDAAKTSGRSLSEEIERRLDKSFEASDITQMFVEHVGRLTSDVAVTFLASNFGGVHNLQAGQEFALHLSKYRANLPEDYCLDDDNRTPFADACAYIGKMTGMMIFMREAFDRTLEINGEMLPGSSSAADRHMPFLDSLRGDLRDAITHTDGMEAVARRLDAALEEDKKNSARREAAKRAPS